MYLSLSINNLSFLRKENNQKANEVSVIKHFRRTRPEGAFNLLYFLLFCIALFFFSFGEIQCLMF